MRSCVLGKITRISCESWDLQHSRHLLLVHCADAFASGEVHGLPGHRMNPQKLFRNNLK